MQCWRIVLLLLLTTPLWGTPAWSAPSMSLEGSTSGSGIYTPIEALKFDKKEDDGKPNTGKVRARGSGCVVEGTNQYNINNTGLNDSTKVCNLIIKRKAKDAGAASGSGDERSSACGTIGDIKRSGAAIPDGYRGVIYDVCQDDNTWKRFRDLELITCEGGGKAGDVRNVSCPEHYTGSATQTCNDQGVWELTSSCLPDTSSCRDGKTRTLPCPLEYNGYVLQSCTGGNWSPAIDTAAFNAACSAVECTNPALSIGETYNDTTACPAGYTGSVTKMCAQNGEYIEVKNSCTMTSSQSCNAGSAGTVETVNTCPPGETGSYKRRCDENQGSYKWVEISNSCSPVTCEGASVGTTRVSDLSCPVGYEGKVMKICGSDGEWISDESNCTPAKCAGGNNTILGGITWQDTDAGVTRTQSCGAYEYNDAGTNVSRKCSIKGVWGDVPDNLACKATVACPALTVGGVSNRYATWPVTRAIDNNPVTVVGTCQQYYKSVSPPTRVCNPDGTWEEPEGSSCSAYCPAGSSGSHQLSWPEFNYGQNTTATCNSGKIFETGTTTVYCGGPNIVRLDSKCVQCKARNVTQWDGFGPTGYNCSIPSRTSTGWKSVSCTFPGISTLPFYFSCNSNNQWKWNPPCKLAGATVEWDGPFGCSNPDFDCTWVDSISTGWRSAYYNCSYSNACISGNTKIKRYCYSSGWSSTRVKGKVDGVEDECDWRIKSKDWPDC